MVALVNGSNAKEFCRGTGGRGGPFACPTHCRKVVRGILCCSFADVKTLGCAFLLEKATGKFKVGVGDVTSGVFERNQMITNVLRKNIAPQCRLGRNESVSEFGSVRAEGDNSRTTSDGSGTGKPHATRTNTGCIMGTCDGGVGRNNLLQMRGA